MTDLQNDMLKKIARSEFTAINGDEPETWMDTETWADTIIETPVDKGVFTSLLKENMVEHLGSGRDAYVRLTFKGMEAYKNLQNPDH